MIGTICRFTLRHADPEDLYTLDIAAYDGAHVEVLAEADLRGYLRDETLPERAFHFRTADGYEGLAYIDELEIVQ